MHRHLTAEQFASLALGLASNEEKAQWRAHLDQCAPCKGAFEGDARLAREMAASPTPQVSPEQWRLMAQAALKRSEALETKTPKRGLAAFFQQTPSWEWRFASLTAAFVMAFAIGWLGQEDEPAASANGNGKAAGAASHAGAPAPSKAVAQSAGAVTTQAAQMQVSLLDCRAEGGMTLTPVRPAALLNDSDIDPPLQAPEEKRARVRSQLNSMREDRPCDISTA